ncbi:nuclear transport factor 2 family protein [Flavobacterium caeni]|nr:nuclear transport factor 2 family protein [Flavobacterium caeni]
MNKFSLFILLLFAQLTFAQEADIRRSIDTFFEGLHQKDTIKMKSVLAKPMVLHSVDERKDGAVFSVEYAAQFYRSVASVPKDFSFGEKLLSCKIQIDGSMAHAWTPYEFYVNGKLSHTGVNSFQLVKEGDKWMIVYCIDTRRKP